MKKTFDMQIGNDEWYVMEKHTNMLNIFGPFDTYIEAEQWGRDRQLELETEREHWSVETYLSIAMFDVRK